MAQLFSGEDFVQALHDNTLSDPIELYGLAKTVKDDLTSIMFSEGMSCEFWTRIPIAMIESVEYETMIRCRDHQHPLVILKLRQPCADNNEASVLASLLRSTPLPSAASTQPYANTPDSSFLAGRQLLSQRTASSVPPLPQLIGRELASGYGINGITGFVQCSAVLLPILNDFQECIDSGGNGSGCARIAARKIAQLACRSYCTCE